MSLAVKEYIKSNSKRLICIEFLLNNNYKLLVINAYLPNANYRRNDVDPEFEEEMDNIEQLCHRYSHVNAVMIVGDLNIDLQRDNAHSRGMCSIAERQGIIFCRNHFNIDYDYIDANVGAGHYSSVDHFIVPSVLYECFDTVVCTDNRLNPSFHKGCF